MTEHSTQPTQTAPPMAPDSGLSMDPAVMAHHQGLVPMVPVLTTDTSRPQVGKIRGTGACIALCVVTLGFYSLYWYYSVHDEMKRHTGTGLGGGVAVLLGLLVGFVMPYFTSSEVGQLSAARGQDRPVSGLTGLWYFPGLLLVVGPLVWFVKTNGALNAYWRSCA